MAYPGTHCTEEHTALGRQLLEPLGLFTVLPSEALMVKTVFYYFRQFHYFLSSLLIIYNKLVEYNCCRMLPAVYVAVVRPSCT